MKNSISRTLPARGIWLALALAIILVTQMAFIPFAAKAVSAAAENYGLKITTQAALEDEDEPKLTYWSGERIEAVATASVSGLATPTSEAHFLLSVPKVLPFLEEPVFEEIPGIYLTRGEDSEKWFVEYWVGEISNGTTLNAPFSLQFKNGITPAGTPVSPTLELVADNYEVKESATATFVANASASYKFSKEASEGSVKAVGDGHGSERVSLAVFDVAGDAAAATRTPAEGVKVTYDLHVFPDPSLGAPVGVGEYSPTSVRLEDTLAEGVELAPESLQAGWSMEGDKAVFTAQWGPSNADGRGLFQQIHLLYKDVPVKTEDGSPVLHQNVATAYVTHRDSGQTKVGTDSGWVEFRASDADITAQPQVEKAAKTPSMVYGHGLLWPEGGAAASGMPGLIEYKLDWSLSDDSLTARALTDHALDSRLRYATFEVTGGYKLSAPGNQDRMAEDAFNDASNVLYGVRADGLRVQIGRDLDIGTKVTIDDPNRVFNSLKLEFPAGLPMNGVGYTTTVGTNFTAEENSMWVAKAYGEPQEYSNSATLSTSHVASGIPVSSNTVTATVTVKLPEPKLDLGGETRFEARVNEQCPGFVPGESPISSCKMLYLFTDHLAAVGKWAPGEGTVDRLRHIVLLPPGVEFDRLWDVKFNNHTQSKDSYTAHVYPNYVGDGRSALIVDLGYDRLVKSDANPDATLSLHYYLRGTGVAKAGENVIEAFSVWTNNGEREVRAVDGGHRYVDALDLDKDGNTTEEFLTNRHTINLIPAKELSGQTEVSVDGTDWFVDSPTVDRGDSFYWRQSVSNGSDAPVSGVQFIDVFPHLRDHAIVPDAHGRYAPRTWWRVDGYGAPPSLEEHSAFTTPLVGPLSELPQNAEILRKFDLFYSLDEQGASLSSVVGATWLSEQDLAQRVATGEAKWADVRMTKAVLKDGQTLEPGYTAHLISKHEVSSTGLTLSWVNAKSAVNSIVVGLGDGKFFDTNDARVNTDRYYVAGRVFTDSNEDGIENGLERGKESSVVYLKNADGTPARDAQGAEVRPVYTLFGDYSFAVDKRGQYKVVTVKAEEERFSPKGQANSGTVSQVESVDGNFASSDVFTLSPGNKEARRDFGVIPGKRNLTIQKVDDHGNPLPGVSFEIRRRPPIGAVRLPILTALADSSVGRLVNPAQAVPLPKPLPKPQPKPLPNPFDPSTEHWVGKTDSAGNLTFENLEFGEYEIYETEPLPGFSPIDPIDLYLSQRAPYPSDQQDGALRVTNRRMGSQIQITKVDADDRNNTLPGAVFELRQGSEVVQVSEPTGPDGITNFYGLPAGEYSVVEATAPVGYSVGSPFDVVVNTDSTLITRTVENRRSSGEVLLMKTDAAGSALPGASFGLFVVPESGPDASPAHTAISGQDGTVRFPDVSFGEYQVREISAPIGYVVSDRSERVTLGSNAHIVDLRPAPFVNQVITGAVVLTKVDAADMVSVL
ncbi:MAG: SpaA isopeptide-forming pilin-related protein, partial [Buchananella hordeovulneris]|nr:SpaA isopeptide-forming pilin-related protein [Buchananella hordeovulneris]